MHGGRGGEWDAEGSQTYDARGRGNEGGAGCEGSRDAAEKEERAPSKEG